MTIGLLILRLVFGITMAAHGVQKLFGWFGGGGIPARPIYGTARIPPGALTGGVGWARRSRRRPPSRGGSLFTLGGRDGHLGHVGGHRDSSPREGLFSPEWRLRVQPRGRGGRACPGFHRSGLAVSGRCLGRRLVWPGLGCDGPPTRADRRRGAAYDSEPRHAGTGIRVRSDVETGNGDRDAIDQSIERGDQTAKGAALFAFGIATLVLSSIACDATAARGEEQVCDVRADYALGVENYPEAIRLHAEVVRKHPDNALAHYHLGFAEGMMGNKRAEVREYQAAAALG